MVLSNAGRLLTNTNTEEPNKREIYYKLDSDTNAILVLHLIRKNKQYAEENFKRNPASIDSETMLPNKSLIKAASIDEIKKYDVVLCITSMASSPRLLDAIVNNIHQLMTAQYGMNTEPVSLNIAILIGDHMQLRPIAMCKQAAYLELDFFERYCKPPVKFVQVRESYILVSILQCHEVAFINIK